MIRLSKIILLCLIFPCKLFCQPQWKFHIAFEDATGAKDTIWMIYDSTANVTTPVDSSLGEAGVTFDYSKFNVWIYNFDNDSTKTSALPYSYFPYHSVEIRAFNYQYPIIVRWDTALIRAPYLPFTQGEINLAFIADDYFFLVNNDPPLQAFNMLKDDSCFGPTFNWGSHEHFPLHVVLDYDPSLNVVESNHFFGLKLYSNWDKNELTIESSAHILKLFLYDITGKLFEVPMIYNELNKYTLFTNSLHPGIYIISILTSQNNFIYEKYIKAN